MICVSCQDNLDKMGVSKGMVHKEMDGSAYLSRNS